VFKTIVLGLDGSKESKQALTYARELAREESSRVIVVHVEEDIVGKGGGPIHATEDEIQAEIRGEAKRMEADGLEVTVEMRSVMLGGPAPVIARIAEESDADVIVVGSRGLSGLPGGLLGSVAQKLIHISKTPVLVLPHAVAGFNGDRHSAGKEKAVSA
jgi:nucleotide-binding universal stress UspA family protein